MDSTAEAKKFIEENCNRRQKFVIIEKKYANNPERDTTFDTINNINNDSSFFNASNYEKKSSIIQKG